MNQSIIILILLCLLTACGSSNESADNSQQNNKNSTKSQSSSKRKSNTAKSLIKVSGAENFTFKNEPKFTCRDDVIHVMTMTNAPKFELYLSSKTSEGTLELVDYDANERFNSDEGKAILALSGNFVKGSGSSYGDFYFTNSKGQVTVLKMPTEKGETFKAKIKASLQSSGGEIVNIDADLNLIADGYLMQNCRF